MIPFSPLPALCAVCALCRLSIPPLLQQSFTSPPRPTNVAGAQAQGVGTAETGGTDGGRAEGEEGGVNGARGEGIEQQGGEGVITGEDAQQAFLSRLLLMLGSFVVLCLVLF